jgi:hypothetical protein
MDEHDWFWASACTLMVGTVIIMVMAYAATKDMKNETYGPGYSIVECTTSPG